MTRVSVDVTEDIVHGVTAYVRKLMLDRATEWCDRLVLAMRDEGITDDVLARVVNRVLTGWPDPDEVIRPADARIVVDAVKSDMPGVTLRGTPCP